MKSLFIVLMISLTACSQLVSGEVQPVIVKDAKQQIMFTTCSGSVEEWGSCNNKARKSCASGYEVIEKVESAVGGKRELTFRCK